MRGAKGRARARPTGPMSVYDRHAVAVAYGRSATVGRAGVGLGAAFGSYLGETNQSL